MTVLLFLSMNLTVSAACGVCPLVAGVLGVIHVVACVRMSLLFMSECYSIV